MSINWEPEDKTRLSEKARSLVLAFINVGLAAYNIGMGLVCMPGHPRFAGVFFALGLFASLSAQTGASK